MKMIVRPKVVLVPYPAQGHVTPMLHLAGALYEHGFQPVMAVPDFMYPRVLARTNANDARVIFVSIPSNLGEGGVDFFAIDRAMENCMPVEFESMLKELEIEGEVACVVVDLLASWAIRIAARCGIKTAGFWPAMFATYRVIAAIPELIQRGIISDSGIPLYELANHDNHQHNQDLIDEEAAAAEEEMKESKHLVLATKPKHSTKDLPWLVGNSASQKSRFKFWLRAMDRANTLPWVLVNSFPQEDGHPDESTKNGPRVLQIGPLLAISSNQNPNMSAEDKACIDWLDRRPPLSVIYVSFGTWVGPIGHEKMAELALGLEATRKPFLWVLSDDSAWRNALPSGFLHRVAEHGKIVSWAPQEAVLGHSAVGCYVTHCGWNSTVEAIRYGKRLICYPISGDQFMNCNFIVRVWGIGIKPDGFGRREVEESMKRVMESKEGEEIQERVLGLKEGSFGGKGRKRAGDALQSFVNAIRKGQ